MSIDNLIWVLWIAMLCWLAWGTWTIHRSLSLNTKPKDWAFLSFWVTLFGVISLPTRWLLNLVFPEHWSEGISGMVALSGSLWILNRIGKIEVSPLKLEFYASRFRPKEVADCLAALEQVRPLFSKTMPATSGMLDAQLALRRVESGVTSSYWREALIESIKGGNSPRSVILYAIVQESKSLLETGQYHIGRGVLYGDGIAIKATFDIALDELVKSGIIDDAGANEQRAKVANAIASAG